MDNTSSSSMSYHKPAQQVNENVITPDWAHHQRDFMLMNYGHLVPGFVFCIREAANQYSEPSSPPAVRHRAIVEAYLQRFGKPLDNEWWVDDCINWAHICGPDLPFYLMELEDQNQQGSLSNEAVWNGTNLPPQALDGDNAQTTNEGQDFLTPNSNWNADTPNQEPQITEMLKTHTNSYQGFIRSYTDFLRLEQQYKVISNKFDTDCGDFPQSTQDQCDLVQKMVQAMINTEDIYESATNHGVRNIHGHKYADLELEMVAWKLLYAVKSAQEGRFEMSRYMQGGPKHESFRYFRDRFQRVTELLTDSKDVVRNICSTDMFIHRLAWNPSFEDRRKQVNRAGNERKNAQNQLGIHFAKANRVTFEEDGTVLDQNKEKILQLPAKTRKQSESVASKAGKRRHPDNTRFYNGNNESSEDNDPEMSSPPRSRRRTSPISVTERPKQPLRKPKKGKQVQIPLAPAQNIGGLTFPTLPTSFTPSTSNTAVAGTPDYPQLPDPRASSSAESMHDPSTEFTHSGVLPYPIHRGTNQSNNPGTMNNLTNEDNPAGDNISSQNALEGDDLSKWLFDYNTASPWNQTERNPTEGTGADEQHGL